MCLCLNQSWLMHSCTCSHMHALQSYRWIRPSRRLVVELALLSCCTGRGAVLRAVTERRCSQGVTEDLLAPVTSGGMTHMLGLASEPRGLRLRGTVSMHASCLDSKLTMALFSSACGSEQPSSSRAAGIMLTGPTSTRPMATLARCGRPMAEVSCGACGLLLSNGTRLLQDRPA